MKEPGRTSAAIVLLATVALELSAQAVQPERQSIASMSLNELRTARRKDIPACARKFTVCLEKVCRMQSKVMGMTPAEVGEWEKCRPEVEKWEMDQLEIRNAILARDPLPSCFEADEKIYLERGVSPFSPEKNLLLIRKLVPLGTLKCTVEHCRWIGRNADDVQSLIHACEELTRGDASQPNDWKH